MSANWPITQILIERMANRTNNDDLDLSLVTDSPVYGCVSGAQLLVQQHLRVKLGESYTLGTWHPVGGREGSIDC